jgi:hypothetical protein
MKADNIIKLSLGFTERCFFKLTNHFLYDGNNKNEDSQ